MASLFICNYIVLKVLGSSQNTYKLYLISTAQMWGSGKTWLGKYFLNQLNTISLEEINNNVLEYLPIVANQSQLVIEGYNALKQARYVYINLKFIRMNNLVMLIFRSLLGVDSSLAQTAINELNMKELDLSDILSWFSKKLNCAHFFFHFDEIDSIFGANVSTEPLYEIWNNALHPLILSGHFVYCSGRTSLLLSIGMTGTRNSPGKNRCLLLDTLKEHHIDEILHEMFDQRFWNIDSESRRNLAKSIFNLTAGVPRLVQYACDFLFIRNNDLKTFEERFFNYILNTK